MKIKRVAVVFQNNIQFESFINAVDIMINRGIIVDLFVPITYSNDGFNIMFDEFFKKISKSKYNIYREPTDFCYDILFETYYIEQYKNLKRKYTIKYMYGLTTKPEYSLSLNINYIFDAFLCYGDMDSICLQNYGKTFTIGNIKYLNSKIEEVEKKRKKKTILYLPTYSNCCSIEKIGNDILLLKKHYNIIVKPHHGTEYLTNSLETSRMEFLKRNFDKVYSSTDSLEEIMKKCGMSKQAATIQFNEYHRWCIKPKGFMHTKNQAPRDAWLLWKSKYSCSTGYNFVSTTKLYHCI